MIASMMLRVNARTLYGYGQIDRQRIGKSVFAEGPVSAFVSLWAVLRGKGNGSRTRSAR